MSYVLADEFGKLPSDVPASKLLDILKKTLVKGIERVGWVDIPSTTNELTKGGGAEFQKIWKAANQFQRKPTVNRIVRFFQPAYEAYEGFIDQFGDSVIGEPTEEQYEYLVKKWVKYSEDGERTSEIGEEDIRKGAKVYVLFTKREGLEGDSLEEEIRMNPCTEEEAFMYAGHGCEFNAVRLKRTIDELEENPPVMRQMRMHEKRTVRKSIYPNKPDIETLSATAVDDAKGGWHILELPEKMNHFNEINGYLFPLNTHRYQIGVDTTKDLEAQNGSKPRILVFKRSCIINGEETGMYPVAMWLADTRLDVHFDEQVLLACMLYGCTANYEIDARADFYKYFLSKRCGAFLEWTPKVARNPVKRNKAIEPGTRSGDPFQLAQQLQIGKIYADGDQIDGYNGHIHRVKYISLLKQMLRYDHTDRTEFDEVIALFMALLPIFGGNQRPKHEEKKVQVLQRHKIKLPA